MFAVDFFCGAGGLTRGFLDAGIRVVAGLDINENCRCTYESNNKPAKFLACDLREIGRQDLEHYIRDIQKQELVFAGCAPCQPFSKQRREIDVRDKTLLSHFGRLVGEFLPGFVVIENVPGIVRLPGNSTYRRFIRRLRTLGYEVSEGVIDAKLFGVPQTRRRWVVIASLFAKPELPEPTHGIGGKPFSTVRDAISHFPSIAAGEQSLSVPNHRAASITHRNLLRLKATPRDGGSRRQWPKELVLDCHRGAYSGHTDVYGRMRWDAPAPALTCKCFSISNGRYGHPEQDRAISLREAARLQSFRDDFVFHGETQEEVGAQIGNAVPVQLARHLAMSLLKLRKQIEKPPK
ncbi:MAG: DNA cytosine methyltransferase [Nitrospiraceae bacterium]|nr:DNA cytosine methyltransferase [Nitrospiraceae bacterium]